jgi:hypothetical protein
LLEITLKSLIQFWDGPKPERLLIYEDQSLDEMHYEALKIGLTTMLSNFCPFDIRHGKRGQIMAIDVLYSEVKTPYIFHCEDDWEFTKTGFVQKSLAILEEKPMTCQVWIRHPNDRNQHPAIGQVITLESGVKYQLMKTGFRGVWHGFSFNCGLRRLVDYQKLFPKGMYADIHWSPSNPLQAEQLVGKQYFRHGFRAATLLEGYCKHIGNNRHVQP